MTLILIVIHAVFLGVSGFVTLTFVISSVWERERRAALTGGMMLCGLLIAGAALFILARIGFFESTPGFALLLVGLLVPLGFSGLLTRTSRNPKALQGTAGHIVGNVQRFDERDHVFARNRSLPPGSDDYREYYSQHPDLEEPDAERRQHGPIGIPGTIDKPHERSNVAATMSCLSMRFHLGRPQVVKPGANPHCAGTRGSSSPEEATETCKHLARHLGADLVGISGLDPLWIYSIRGDIHGEDRSAWGKEIEVAHTHAIVFGVEMSREMIATAPHFPTTMESCNIYAKMALIASELAGFIANLGYSATANHFGYYEAILPPMAVDAGLGEIGRLGYLLTKEFGPRVRLGCVTTDLPLVPDRPADIGVEDFCTVCKKCAVCCPSESIPYEDASDVNGILRWKLDAESCFEYWGRIGTDCCVCMRVCPWGHPRTFPHRLITNLVVRNRWARRIFSFMDDVFYGKNPKPASPPKWAAFTATQTPEV